MASLEILLGVVAAVVLIGVLAVRVSVRLGLPSLLLYLGIGLLLGEAVLGIQFSDAALTESLGLAALVLILIEGGLTTRWNAVRPALGVGIALSTVAVMVSIAVVGVALHLLLGLEWRTAFLWGAVLSSTDAAAVFSVLRGVGRVPRVSGTLELESGMNDAPVVLAVLLLASGDPFTWVTPLLVVYELAAGGLIGGLFGLGGAWALRRVRAALDRPLPAGRHRGLRAGLLDRPVRARLRPAGHLRRRPGAGQLRPAAPRRRALVRRGPGLAGPDRAVRAARAVRLAAPAAERGAAGAGRRGGAGGCWPGRCRWSRPRCRSACPWREQAFLSWSGLRGAVPIVLALIALTEGAPSAHRAGGRGLRAGRGAHPAAGHHAALGGPRGSAWCQSAAPQEIAVDAAPLDELGADLLQVRIPLGSRLRGVYLQELRLPRGATVSLVVRDGAASPRTRRPGCASSTSCWWWPRRGPGARPRTGSGRSTSAASWPAGTSRTSARRER